jgi:hypothetical protein
MSDTEKEFYKQHYKCTQTIKGKQKGSLNSFVLFLEKAHSLVKEGGMVNMIVPMSITSSDSVTALHNLLYGSCSFIEMSHYAHRPQQIFVQAGQAVSIIKFYKDNKQCEKLLSTMMYRKDKEIELEDIIDNLEFIDVSDLKLFGRIPRISYEIERSILKKVLGIETTPTFANATATPPQEENIGESSPSVEGSQSVRTDGVVKNIVPISDLRQDTGSPIYYRKAGGQYFKVITNYPQSAESSEGIIFFNKKYQNVLGAIMSSNLFFYWHQIISDILNLKLCEIDMFGVPINKLTDAVIEKIEKLYAEYLADIEQNLIIHKESAKIRPQEYKLVKSKHLIDQIDDIICPLYGLTQAETDFIKNYEIKFRMRGGE